MCGGIVLLFWLADHQDSGSIPTTNINLFIVI